MPIVDGISKAIAGLPSSPGFDRLMSKISNPAPGNAAPYLVPEAAVIGGRSGFAWVRNGFLEFQERFLEETVVAAFWFWGVSWMEKIYDKLWKKAPGNLKHLDLNADWGFAKRKSLELSPGERYAFNNHEWKKILMGKGGKLFFSVGATLAIVALLIPWLNQKKTEWILKKYYGAESHGGDHGKPAGKPEKSGKTPESTLAGLPRAVRPEINPGMHGLLPNQNPAWTTPSGLNALPPDENPAWTTGGYPYYAPYPMRQPFGSPYAYPQQGETSQIRFGFAGGSALQLIGHGIQNTDVGRMLVIDTGITGGRAAVAAQRSGFESAEIVFRDGVSLYFYILAVPHAMKLLNKVINPHLAASILLDPGVATHLNAQIMGNPALKEALLKGEIVPKQMEGILREAFYGYEDDAIRRFPKGWLQQSMRTAPVQGGNGLAEILKREYRVMFSENGAKYSDAVLKQLGSQASVDDVSKVIEHISKGQGPFAGASKATRADMISGLKHAFGYTVGISVEDLQSKPLFREMLKKLPEHQRKALEGRMREMAAQDGRDLANKMYRRSLNVGRHHLGASHELIREAELLSTWLEKSASYHFSPEKLISSEAMELLETLNQKHGKLTPQQQSAFKKLIEFKPVAQGDITALDGLLKEIGGTRKLSGAAEQLQKLHSVLVDGVPASDLLKNRTDDILARLEKELAGKSADSAGLLKHYRKALGDLFGGNRRIFSLALDEVDKVSPELTRKIQELIKGGLVNDSKFMTEALRITHVIGEDARSFASSAKTAEMHEAMKDYLNTMLKHMDEKKAGTRWTQEGFETFTKYFQKLGKNSSYLSRWIGLGVAMLGLGIMVPKLQYALTRHLTGKDEHPGIAAVAKKVGIDPTQFEEGGQGKTAGAAADAANPLYSGPPLRRNGFSAFRQYTA